MKSSTVRIAIVAILALAIASVVSWMTADRASAKSSLAASGQDIGAARSALGNAISQHKARSQKGKSPEVTDAFRAYKTAVDRRKAEIYERLKQLDILIAEPVSNSAFDDPTRSAYRHPRSEVSAFVAEYDSYRAELSALIRDFKSVKDQVNLILDVPTASCPPSTAINGTLGSGSTDFPATSGQQTGRITNGLGNITCGSSNPCTLDTAIGLRSFDAYAFTNPGATTACVTVNFTATDCSNGRPVTSFMQFSARLGSFDPANPCMNYVGDAGAAINGEASGSFSFNVPAGQDFVVVVNENDPDGATGCEYILTISGITCEAPCPPSTAINGTLGSGSTDFPATSGQQTGRITNGLGNTTCGSSNPCTLDTLTGLRAFDAYTFSNPGGATVCVTVSFTVTGCTIGQAMHFSARIGSFDPANPCTNYVGDADAAFSGEASGSFSFNVGADENFIIVVNESDPGGATGCAYTLTISGIDCSGIDCVITCPSNITQPNDSGQCGAVVNFSAPTTSGGCGAVSCDPPSGSFFPAGTTTITCTTETGPSCSFTVTVQTPPPVINCPANVTAVAPPSCNQSAGAVVNFATPTASDVCGSVTPVCSPPSGSSFPIGTTTVTCTATGAGGSTSNCSFTVTVFGACLQDDGNAGNVVLFNTSTGEYRFCCGGVVIAAGKGTVTKKGCEFTIQHNTNDRRVLIKPNFSTGKGTASIQAPPGTTRCTITDRNILDNSCQCGGV